MYIYIYQGKQIIPERLHDTVLEQLFNNPACIIISNKLTSLKKLQSNFS